MTLFWKTSAGVLLTVVLVITVGRQERDLALLLSMAACTMVSIVAFAFLEPVISFLHRLAEMGELQEETLSVLLRTVGIGFVSEIGGMICHDSGNASLAKGIRFLGSAVMLWMSVPVMENFLDSLQSVLGGL